MRKFTLFGIAAALVVAVPATAVATSTYNHPVKAKSLVDYLVTAHEECTSPAPPAHLGGISAGGACVPVQSGDLAFWESSPGKPKGWGRVRMDKLNGNARLRLEGHYISVGTATGPLYDGPAQVTARYRVTDNYCAPSGNPVDCTLPDANAAFMVSSPTACIAGTCSIDTDLNTLIPDAAGPGRNTSIDINDITVGDAVGDESFRPGIYIG